MRSPAIDGENLHLGSDQPIRVLLADQHLLEPLQLFDVGMSRLRIAPRALPIRTRSTSRLGVCIAIPRKIRRTQR